MEKSLKFALKMFALHIFPRQNIFGTQYSFLPPNDIYSQKILQKILLAKFPPPKESAPSKHALQNFFSRKFLPKRICSPFCSQIFIQMNLLPKFFLPKFAVKHFLFSILLLTMKFQLQKFLQNTFAGKISSHQESAPPKLAPQNFLPRKFA